MRPASLICWIIWSSASVPEVSPHSITRIDISEFRTMLSEHCPLDTLLKASQNRVTDEFLKGLFGSSLLIAPRVEIEQGFPWSSVVIRTSNGSLTGGAETPPKILSMDFVI